MAKTYKLDIFKTLNSISTKDSSFFDNLSEEEQKAFQPLVVMRWLSGTKKPLQIIFLNELVNPLVFSIPNHKKLLVQLMAACSPGRSQRYVWNKNKSKKSTSMPKTVGVIKEYFGYNTRDAKDSLVLLDNATVVEMCEDLGWQKEDLRQVQKELKSRT